MDENEETSKIYEKTEFTWIFEVIDRYKTGTYKKSSVFPGGSEERKYYWKIGIFLNDERQPDDNESNNRGEHDDAESSDSEYDDSESDVSLYLFPATSFECYAKFSFVLKNSKDDIILERKKEGTFRKDKKGVGFQYLTTHEILKNWLQEDNIIKISVTVWAEIFTLQSFHLPEMQENKIPALKLSRELKTMFTSNIFSDFVFEFEDGNELKVHRCVLAARSEVFSGLFEYYASEKKSRCAKISDIEHETMVALLNFVYTGIASNLSLDEAKKVAYAANKYKLDDLKHHCGNILADNLNFSNTLEILQLADQYNMLELKDKTLEYMVKSEKFSHPGALDSLDCSNTLLITELFLKREI